MLQRPLNGGDGVLFGGKPQRALLCDHLVSDPDGELAARAFNDVYVGSRGTLDKRRHTDGARLVVSNLAVSNANVLHDRLSIRIIAQGPALFKECGFEKARLDRYTGFYGT